MLSNFPTRVFMFKTGITLSIYYYFDIVIPDLYWASDQWRVPNVETVWKCRKLLPIQFSRTVGHGVIKLLPTVGNASGKNNHRITEYSGE